MQRSHSHHMGLTRENQPALAYQTRRLVICVTMWKNKIKHPPPLKGEKYFSLWNNDV